MGGVRGDTALQVSSILDCGTALKVSWSQPRLLLVFSRAVQSLLVQKLPWLYGTGKDLGHQGISWGP